MNGVDNARAVLCPSRNETGVTVGAIIDRPLIFAFSPALAPSERFLQKNPHPNRISAIGVWTKNIASARFHPSVSLIKKSSLLCQAPRMVPKGGKVRFSPTNGSLRLPHPMNVFRYPKVYHTRARKSRFLAKFFIINIIVAGIRFLCIFVLFYTKYKFLKVLDNPGF